MNILWHIHAYPPVHNAGAEWMAHDMNRHLIKRHDIRVLTGWEADGEFEGVKVVHMGNPANFHKQYEWADVVISHLGCSGMAYNFSKRYRKPLVFVSHNTHSYTFCRQGGSHVFVVYNAKWVIEKLDYRRPGIIVHPPVWPDQWKAGKRGKHIALININENKGGAVLEQIARLMPDRKFLAVRGMYGKQHETYPDNVKVIDNTPDMQKVYDKCRIVLMPSDYESWGRVGVEALACGIPVIANPTPGLRESLGVAGIFADRNNPQEWVEAIGALDDESVYFTAREMGLARARSLDPQPQLDTLEAWLHDIREGKKRDYRIKW
jgi:glycosyltransferase involved in cell wall biosynthesis